ncbi:LHFPL tetraspan subfamily member 7 protein-like [Phascolarctos cinereus]|uniref:Transmembrane protein 211-like n=1 Tax=Phascolarctos cinereus TaxID=38626 RepID=A0A6P5IP93_PHACI|nr:transmembrane protein 211-like [Phascolarctos cinereus]XP_020820435.1 transmembrane protein 211-like [Phascolarctos cinereus]
MPRGLGVGGFWALLSCGLAALCALGLLSPAWIVPPAPHGPKTAPPPPLGLLGPCLAPAPRPCAPFALGGLRSFGDIPASAWQTSTVLCSGGWVLLALSALLAVVSVFLPSGLLERRVCALAGYMQMAAVFIMASGLLVYPLGLGSASVKSSCGNSIGIYNVGSCQLGWGYTLAIVGVMLSGFLPFFAKYAPKEHISPTPMPAIL